ncbi:MAG TPA: tRNA 2-thiouridine(34) synthase MnmA [Sandaracinaceae bacterium LLY-WYZ-13_1]|nr:tRNA 2-thiouridine(34) synthase MnmA [Sandaracinaceae bacterium LLY-WYZ-13_1]
MPEPSRVLVAMSGGVDSSVAAALLREQGHELVGVTLHLWDASGSQAVGRCCSPEDRDDARRTCEHLGIPHFVFDERRAFRDEVVDPFLADYRAGRTPSPCVHCNQQVKLGRLLEIAEELGASHVATGHYARIARDSEGDIQLLRGRDATKDQSYFLYGVPRQVLSRTILPLGAMEKGQTREEGRRLGVPNWDKKDSQELCFVPDGDVGAFVERETGARGGGAVVDTDGRELARHGGVYRFTVGQRRGLGLGGGGEPRYVLRIVPDTEEVVVGPRDALLSRDARATDVVWTAPPPADSFEAAVQVRYRHRAAPARVTPTADGFVASFHEPQRAITPGQAAVVYRGERVIGGGVLAA